MKAPSWRELGLVRGDSKEACVVEIKEEGDVGEGASSTDSAEPVSW